MAKGSHLYYRSYHHAIGRGNGFASFFLFLFFFQKRVAFLEHVRAPNSFARVMPDSGTPRLFKRQLQLLMTWHRLPVLRCSRVYRPLDLSAILNLPRRAKLEEEKRKGSKRKLSTARRRDEDDRADSLHLVRNGGLTLIIAAVGNRAGKVSRNNNYKRSLFRAQTMSQRTRRAASSGNGAPCWRARACKRSVLVSGRRQGHI